MPLENANKIGQLNPLWPLGTDPRGQGDDHIRMLKRTLLALNTDLFAALAPGWVNAQSEEYGAIGDGTYHPVQEWVDSGKFAGLAAIQVAYPHVVSLQDSIDWAAIEAALSNSQQRTVLLFQGRYLLNRGINVLGYFLGEGVLGGWRGAPFSNIPQTLYDTRCGTELVFVGNGEKIHTLPYVTESRQCGFDRPMPAEYRYYNNSYDAEMLLADFTNKDAVGAAPATLKPFSAAVVMGTGLDTLYPVMSLQGLRVVTSCPGDEEEYGLKGYSDQTSVRPWAHWDIGVYAKCPWRSYLFNVQIVGYWDMRGVLMTSMAWQPDRTSIKQDAGVGEYFKLDRCLVQGGVAVRNADFWPILSKTPTTLTVEWTRSHQFLSSGTLRIGISDSTTLTYTGLVYNAGDKTLTFTGIPSTANIVLDGLDQQNSHIWLQTNGGIANMSIVDSELNDFAHATRVLEQSPLFAPYQMPFRGALEISGHPCRGICLRDTSLFGTGPVAFHFGSARDVEFYSCYCEPKSFKLDFNTTAPHGAGAAFIYGPKAAYMSRYPRYQWGVIESYGKDMAAYVNRSPWYTPPRDRRLSNATDLYNPRGSKAAMRDWVSDRDYYTFLSPNGKTLRLAVRDAETGGTRPCLEIGEDGAVKLGAGYTTVDNIFDGKTFRHEHDVSAFSQMRTTSEASSSRAAYSWDLYSESGNIYFRNFNRAAMDDPIDIFQFSPWDGSPTRSKSVGCTAQFSKLTLIADEGSINIEGRTSDSRLTMFAWNGVEIGGYGSYVNIKASSGGSGNNYLRMEGPTGGYFYESQYDIRMQSAYGGYVRILEDALRIRASSTQSIWLGNIASGNLIGIGPKTGGGYEMRTTSDYHQQVNLGAANASYNIAYIVNWYSTSDKRAKTKISYEFPEGLLPVWLQIRPALFAYLETPGEMQVGVIAQDIVELFQQSGFDAVELGIVQENPCDVSEQYPEGITLTVAYSKLLLMEMWANRLRLDRIEKAMGLV